MSEGRFCDLVESAFKLALHCVHSVGGGGGEVCHGVIHTVPL